MISGDYLAWFVNGKFRLCFYGLAVGIGTPGDDASWPQNIFFQMCRYFLLQAAMVILSLIIWQKYFFIWIWAPGGTTTLVHSLLMKSRRRKKACDVLYACATHASLVHDVTDTDCQTQNGGAYGCMYHNDFETLIFNKVYPKSSPDITPSVWLGSKHQPTNKQTINQLKKLLWIFLF